MSQRQRGNILFLILLAVILFAALSYAVTSQRDGGKNAAPEKLDASISVMLQDASLLEQTINRLMLVNGCKDTDISFENATVGGYINPNANVAGMNKKCHIFDKAGGGLSWPVRPDGLEHIEGEQVYQFHGTSVVEHVGTPEADLILYLRIASEPICAALNKKLMGMDRGGMVENYNNNQHNPFRGVYGGTMSIGDSAISSTAFPPGHRAGCFYRSQYGSYGFYYVVLAR